MREQIMALVSGARRGMLDAVVGAGSADVAALPDGDAPRRVVVVRRGAAVEVDADEANPISQAAVAALAPGAKPGARPMSADEVLAKVRR